MNYSEESLKLHKQHHGKLSIASKIPVTNKEELAVAYTPGVGAVSSAIAEDPRLAKEMTMKRNSVAIVTDGSAVLGLGNLGPLGALPVMEGKAILFKEFANIDAFPICLDTQDKEEIIQTVKHIAPTFGGINLEDIAAPLCFEIEARLKAELDIPVMHDDQQGTAVVVLAGLINATKLRGISVEEAKLVINGAGAAGIAIAKLLLAYGFKNITLCDSVGSIYSGRDGLNSEKAAIAEVTNLAKTTGGLAEIISGSDIFIGVSKANTLSPEMVKTMNERPIIFALANPIPEIMPDVALEAGAYIVATGRSDFPNQINNVLAFPGIFRGALDNGVVQITQEMFLQAAKNLAACVEKPSTENILPGAFDKHVMQAVSEAIK
jgi:malate dehydrogenase (oxaloacetate-decarboxylating)